MGNELLRDVVAHELGHAWSYTFDNSLIRTLSHKSNQAEIEWEADLAADYWGRIGNMQFSMHRWRQWAADNPAVIGEHLRHGERFVLPPLASLNVQPADPARRIQTEATSVF
jgi:hypothetical protein